MSTRLTATSLKFLLESVARSQVEAIDCNECWEKIDHFVELELEGKDPAQALPLVEDHLNCCGDCREEYEALLEALKNLS
jgi:hypothetical protein